MIRPIAPCDTARVMQLWLQGNIDAHPFIPQRYWTENIPAVQAQLLRADVYVYKTGAVIQGFAGLQNDYLAGIFVSRAARCTGVGKELLNAVKARRTAFFLHVYQKNERAVSFYRREGLTIAALGTDEATGCAEYTMVWTAKQPAEQHAADA